MIRPLIVIPSRLGATRLPRKPLADIGGEPMIVHVWRRAMEAKAGDVVVATDSGEIADAIARVGGNAVMTRADHASGSDRVFEAVNIVDPDGNMETVVNLQGDQPFFDPSAITDCLVPLNNPATDISTVAALISETAKVNDPAVVKMIGTPLSQKGHFRALYFSRAAAPSGPGPLFEHIGIYAYRRDALAQFVQMPPSVLEMREKLEQLRALEAGMRIDVKLVEHVPISVDTPEDLERARAVLTRPIHR